MDNRVVFGHPSALVGADAVQLFEVLGIHIHHLRKAARSEKRFHLIWLNAKNTLFSDEPIQHSIEAGLGFVQKSIRGV
jgi:hypothetical protein